MGGIEGGGELFLFQLEGREDGIALGWHVWVCA